MLSRCRTLTKPAAIALGLFILVLGAAAVDADCTLCEVQTDYDFNVNYQLGFAAFNCGTDDTFRDPVLVCHGQLPDGSPVPNQTDELDAIRKHTLYLNYLVASLIGIEFFKLSVQAFRLRLR